MTSLIQAQITAGPGQAGSLLADLNDRKPWYALHNDFTLGAATRTGDRTAKLTVRMRGKSCASEVSAVMRAINRPESYLLWQVEGDDPIWYRILDTVSEMDFSQTSKDDPTRTPIWTVSVSLTVGPYGYGERVTEEAVIVSNQLMGFAMDNVKGDAVTDAVVTVKLGGSQVWSNWTSLLSVIPVLPSCSLGAPVGVSDLTPLPAVIQWEAEAFTRSGDAVAISSAALSGGAGVGIPEGNTAWRQVLSGVVPVKPPPGRYQVWMRCSRATNGAKMRFRCSPQEFTALLDDTAALYSPPAIGVDGSWLHVSDMSFPAGQPFDGLTEADITTPTIALYAKGFGITASNVVVDRFALVPIELAQGGEAETAVAAWPFNGPFGPGPLWNSWRIDAEQGRSGLVAYDGAWFSSATPPRRPGGLAKLHPGVRNVFTLIHRVHDGRAAGSDLIGDTVEVTVSYHPRFRHQATL